MATSFTAVVVGRWLVGGWLALGPATEPAPTTGTVAEAPATATATEEATATATVAADTRTVLELDGVLAATLRDHPLLDAASATKEAAEGRHLSARGAFDPRLRARAAGTPLGYYRYGVVDTEVRARTIALGMVAFAGWRLGRGDIPVYDGKLATTDAGEIRAGIELPVLRDAAIDGPRAQRKRTDVEVDIATLEREAKALELSRDAAIAYWDWVAARGRAEVRTRQLRLAQDRDLGLRRQAAEGNIAEIELLDNARVIATREAIVVGAERDATVTALALSLYLRDAMGEPVIPDAFAAPHLVVSTMPADHDVQADVAAARDRRPDVRIAGARLRIAAIDVRLARNSRLPALGVQTYAAKDLGDGPDSLRPAELGVGVGFEIPIPLRTARGDLAAARAVERRIGHERRFLLERVGVEIRAAHADTVAAHRRAEIATRQASLAERLAEAERQRLALGDSTVLVVNLREEAAADAAAAAIDAVAEYRRAHARYRVATGRTPAG